MRCTNEARCRPNEKILLNGFICFFQHNYLNSDHGIGCVYSPLGLVIFVAVEGTFVCFT